MATYTRTVSGTITTTRLGFINAQVKIALRRSMHYIDEETLNRVFDQGIRKGYIKQIDIYGMDTSGYCRAQLRIQIDWQRHQIHIREGRDMLVVPGTWMEIGAIEIDELTKLFREFVTDEQLETTWQFYWADWVDVAVARQELGTVEATPPTWRGRPTGMSTSVTQADEMQVGCYLAG